MGGTSDARRAGPGSLNLNEGHEMKTIEEAVSMIHLESSHKGVNTRLVTSSRDGMTQYAGFSAHQWFEFQGRRPRSSSKQTF
jgi:hypothetical protein